MENKILVETSARHVHVDEATLAILFGADAKLTVKKELSQPGQFASEQKVDLVGPKNTIKGVSILGPCRKANQVEVSYTDARTLGVKAPLRESGHTEGSAPIKLVGPCGEVELSEGTIVAKRHIHITPNDSASAGVEAFGVKDGEVVSVKVESPTGRSLVFGDTVVRVSSSYALAMHVDTDESNAAGLACVVYGELVK